MIYLTAEQVLFLHARIVEETGGTHGVRDLGLLESAVARPLASFGGQDLYPSLIDKAAALLESLVGNHPFVDGNKRTGVAAAGLLLERNARRLTATNEELEAFAVAVAEGRESLDTIRAWLENHSRSIESEHDGS